MELFVYQTLTILEDIGMSIQYPDISHVSINDDGTNRVYSTFLSMIGNRISIEQNQSMKFMMIFMLLDFYIDSNYPELEGKSFSQKYRTLPSNNDYNLIIRELYRVAKVIRNSLVHNFSSFNFSDGELKINYNFKNTDFEITISSEALISFYTSIVMYIKGDIGNINYFLGITRSTYQNILFGISNFSDEFGKELNSPSAGLKIKPYSRQLIMNTKYEVRATNIIIDMPRRLIPEWQGVDFYIEFEKNGLLIPIEALSSELFINKQEAFKDWKYEGPFPPIRTNIL